MTNTKIRRIITKGVIMIAVLSMLIGGIVTHALTSVYSGAEGDAPNFSFDYSEVLTAPTAINTGDGTYYVPTAYVYYGRRYDSVNQKYVSLLHRVLDPKADNTGAGGAMFLLAENTAHSSRFSPYNDDTVAGYLDNENSYVTSTLRQKLYSGKYTVYEIAYVNTSSVDSLPQELDYIRPITKTDTTENMNGYFGYAEGESSYIWGVVDKDGKPVDSLTILDGERVFPLSAEELYSYVGSDSFSGSTAKEIFAASDVLDGTFDSWWLRTAFILAGGEENSDLVGIVDADGKVTYSSAQNTLPTRNALNIETSEIAFVERVADKTYRLAFNAPEYKEGEQFEAYITDVKDGRVTFTVKNHIGDSNWQHAGESRISYVITDSEGNEKYYGVAGTVRETASVGQKVSEEETFTFTLPGCYEVGDRVQVFSERVDDPERISTSYVSNFVDLGCIHIPAEGYEANCLHEAKCALCGIYYGSTDENNHRDVSNVWTYNEGEGTHSRECLNCSAKAYTEPCSFGRGNLNAPYACYESSCNGCGHKIDSPTLHNYDERGICLETHGEYHYEMPKIENDANIGFIARVGTVGEWNALALWLNGGGYLHRLNETKYVIITEDLDFTDIPFIPMGTEELPVKRIDIRAQHKTFSNIEYTIEGAPAGIIAVGEDVAVDDLILEDSVFGGSDVGAVVGRLTDTAESLSDFSGIAVTGVELYGTNVGGIVGTLTEKASLSLSFVYDVTHNGINVDFSSDGKLIPTPASDNDGMPYGGCYRLAPEGDGEFAFTYEQFASGEVTYRLRQIDPYWKQTLGAHPHPVYCRDESVKRVYAVISCDSSDVIYSNEDLGKIQHGEYTSFVPSTFEWVDGVGEFGVGFKVNAVCGLCEKETEVILPAEWGVYYSFSGRFIARMEFNAYIEIGGYRERVNTEPKVIYSTRLEDLIGMTPITVTYNGYNQYTDVLFGNLREGLDERDFDAYFLDPVTGERVVEMQYDYYGRPTYFPTGVKNVGTYDVLMVGKGGFEGYEYIYEDVFTIKKATVTVEPKDVDKIYDGNREFSAEYELLGDYVADLDLDISLENAPSEKVGAYILKVNADLTSHNHGDNIELTLLCNTVTALILPDLRIELSNRSYPEQITYGDPIPAVKDECFNVSADATLSYQWFTAGYNSYDGYFAQRAIDAPTDAGVYILRVQAMSKDGSLISNTLDLKFEVMKRSLTVDLYAPSGVEREEINYRTFYVLDPGEAFTYRISGFVGGDTAEALGLDLKIYLRAAEGGGSVETDYDRNPSVPFKYGYQVEYNLPKNKNYEVGKYVIHNGTDTEESAYGVFYIYVRSPGYVYPVETDFTADGDAISPNILISVPIAGITPNGDEFDYIFRVFNADGIEILEKVSSTDTLDLVYLYDHTVRESWSNGHTVTRGAFSAEGEYRVILQIEGEGMSATFETSFTLQFFNSYGEGVADMVEPGLYTVAVINEDGDTYEARLYAKQKLTMNLKPHEYSISEGRVEYDPTRVVMEAGNVIHLDHTLVDVYFHVDENQGKIYVNGVKIVDKDGNDVSRLYAVEYDSFSGWSHSSERNVCHIFDNPCDHSCNISGCDYVRAVSHSGGAATCTDKAICEICGIAYGEYSSERHVSDKTIIYPNVFAPDESHLIVYVCCGGTKETVAHTHVTPATCTERAVCSECGWEYGEFDPENHSSSNPTYENNGDAHKVTHHCCGAVETEDHSGGVAYCNKAAVCALCGGSYGEYDPENHAEKIQYIPDASDPNRHNALYACCGESTSYTHSGGDATCISKMVCDFCRAEYGELEPADHASDALAYRQDMDNPSLHTVHHACCDVLIEKDYHSGGEANCKSPALCSSCGTPYGEYDPENHASDKYSYYADPDNASLHIKVLSCCGEFADNEEHSYGEATCTHAARCACGAESGEPIAHTYDNDCDAVCNVCGEQTRAEAFHVGKAGKPCENCGEMIPREPISGSGISAIVTASTVAASAGGFSLFWFVIKKKTLAELLALILK